MEFFVYFFTFYIAVKIYISTMQIGYIAKERLGKPILMDEQKFKEAGEYAIYKERLGIIESTIEYILFILWVGFGFSFLESILPQESFALQNIAFVLGFLVINQLISMPVDIYKVFVLDKRFGFTKTTPKLYTLDLLKSLAMLVVFGSLIVYGISLIIDSFENWWLYSFLAIFVLIIFINAIYPTLIAPIFNKFTPLKDEELESKIAALMERCGFRANGVFVMDASKRDARLNAYFGGLGSSKRVVLFDTLLEKITHSELLAVLGHELGHFKHGDMYKNIVISGLMLFVLFFIFGNLPASIYYDLGVKEEPYALISLLLLLGSSILFFIMPLVSFISRKNEYRADQFGSSLSSSKDLVEALLKLSGENKSFPKSHPIYVFFYYSHPPLVERLKELGYRVES